MICTLHHRTTWPVSKRWSLPVEVYSCRKHSHDTLCVPYCCTTTARGFFVPPNTTGSGPTAPFSWGDGDLDECVDAFCVLPVLCRPCDAKQHTGSQRCVALNRIYASGYLGAPSCIVNNCRGELRRSSQYLPWAVTQRGESCWQPTVRDCTRFFFPPRCDGLVTTIQRYGRATVVRDLYRKKFFRQERWPGTVRNPPPSRKYPYTLYLQHYHTPHLAWILGGAMVAVGEKYCIKWPIYTVVILTYPTRKKSLCKDVENFKLRGSTVAPRKVITRFHAESDF